MAEEYEEFEWKSDGKIFKGVGIYHITFVVSGRKRLLGELVEIPHGAKGENTLSYDGDVTRPQDKEGLMPDNAKLPYEGWRKELSTSELATVRLSPLGTAILHDLRRLPSRYADPGAPVEEQPLQICAKQFMDNHLHVVIYVRKKQDKSIRQIAQGFRIGVRRIAEDSGVWKQEDGHFFQKPFIRTLSHYSQLPEMIRYVHGNPDSKWRERQNPELYTIRRSMEYAGLHFDCMGKARLLAYPDRQVIALSRSLSKEQIAAEVQKALRKAERGVVTYCAAMNDGEKTVTKAIREVGYPLVVMMLNGFPPAGSEAERFYKPGGAYHKACGEGKLYLMAPLPENYNDPRLIDRTEAELKRKAEEKGKQYYGIPHDSTRWRMIAGNVMLETITSYENEDV